MDPQVCLLFCGFWDLNSDPHACRYFVPHVTFPDPLSLKRNSTKPIILPLLLPESLSRDFCLQLPLKDPRPLFQDTLIHGMLVPVNLSPLRHSRSPFQPRSPNLPLLATVFIWIFSLCFWTWSTSHKAIRRNLMLESMTPGLPAWTLCSEHGPQGLCHASQHLTGQHQHQLPTQQSLARVYGPPRVRCSH